MKPPKRMCEDAEIPRELRIDLTHAQVAARDYDHLAKLDRLRTALGQNQSPEGEPPATGTSGEGLALGAPRARFIQFKAWPWGWKLALMTALGGAGATAMWPATAPVRRVPATVPAPAKPASAPAPSVEAPETGIPVPSMARASDAERAKSRAAPGGMALGREVDQLAKIRALLRHDPASAYRLARQAEREFPDGALREEREALSLMALNQLGRQDEARPRARAFLARYPQSTMRNVIEALLEP